MSSNDLGHLSAAPALSPATRAARPQLDSRPPGERYYRHPGDVVRLVVWGCATALLAVLVSAATATTDGVTSDLGEVAARVSRAVRELSLALLQVGAVVVPAVVAVLLVWLRRWRRLGFLLLAGLAGAAAVRLLDIVIDLGGRAPGAVTSGTWVASTRFPSLEYLGGVAAAVAVGKPWLSRAWRRAADLAVVCLVLVMGFAGTAGVPDLLLAVAAGAMVGAALLVGFGAPNRRPSPDAVGSALRDGGLDVAALDLVRAEGGRSQLYVATVDGDQAFVKVYGRDSRDADLLYRGYRHLALRGLNDEWPSLSLEHDVDHEAFLLLWARQGGVACPGVEAVASLPDGSIALALEYVDGRPLDTLDVDEIDDQLLDATWGQVRTMHARRLAHRALRAGNILVTAGGPVVIDLGFGMESATPRMQAIDRAELLTSLATLVGPERALASAARVIEPEALAAAAPFIQPLALSSATRRPSSKVLLKELRDGVAEATGREPPPMERLVRVRPRLLLMIAVLVGAFYLLLPQLAHVGDSFTALRSASWPWLLVSVVMSLLTYFAGALGNAGGVLDPLPVVPNIEVQFASSFVNRVSPANVGGMALNVRFLRKAGVEPAAAVTGVGLNALVGALVHVGLLVIFFAWAGQSGASSFKIPSSSKLLVAIAVVFALAGIVSATRKGRRLIRTRVWGFIKRSASSMAALAQSPVRLAQLFGGSVALTLAYIGALAAAVAAFHGGVSVAQVGAVYLGASIIAAAAPSPGGLGALEAALVAGLTGVHMEPGAAVAAVLSYRLLTYWLPILPGWLAFHHLERKGQI